MSAVRLRARRFDDRGATAVEYALIAALIAVVAMVGVALLGSNLLGSFASSNEAVAEAVTGVAPAEADDPEAVIPAAFGPEAAAPEVGTPVEYATWERIGESDNYRWECANNFNLGAAGNPVRRSTPSGSAPACQ